MLIPISISLSNSAKYKKRLMKDCIRCCRWIPCNRIDTESQELTTFVTELGHYLYLRLPKGFLAPNDDYTCRYDTGIKNMPCKVKIIDDTCLYDHNIEEGFFHTWDYISLCATNRIVINQTKFKFCQDIEEFLGLHLPHHE